MKLEFGGEGVPRASGHDGRVGEERVRRIEEGGGQFGMSLRMEGEGMSAIGFIARRRASHWQDSLTVVDQLY